MGDIGKYFNKSEFACPCCGICEIDMNLVYNLDNIREGLGTPLNINSACRCEKHNKEVGGVDDSAHLVKEGKECTGADIRIEGSTHRFKVLEQVYMTVINRVGVGNTLVHVDVDKTKPPMVMWVYGNK